jgi:putative phage-type endonuclease
MSTELEQLSDEWFEARVGMITGSRVPAILGHSPWASRKEVMREMIKEHQGGPREFKGNVATQWGNDHEVTARCAYEAQTGRIINETGFHKHPTIDYIGVSPDGLHFDHGLERVIEIKCPYSGKIPDEVPAHYYDQCQLLMHTLDVAHCDLYYWTETDTHIFPITLDNDWWDASFEEMERFIDEFNDKKDEEIEETILATAALDAAEDLISVREKIEELKGLEKYLRDTLMMYVNPDKDTIIGDVKVTHRERSGSIDYKAMEKDGIDVERYRRKPSKYTTFQVIKESK